MHIDWLNHYEIIVTANKNMSRGFVIKKSCVAVAIATSSFSTTFPLNES